jgi:hypothetical protein
MRREECSCGKTYYYDDESEFIQDNRCRSCIDEERIFNKEMKKLKRMLR